MWTKDPIESSPWNRGLLSPCNKAAFTPHNLPRVWIMSSIGFFWAPNKTNSSSYIHTYSQGEEWLSTASNFLPGFSEWMDALLGLDGLLLQPTVENMTTQQQVGERGLLGQHRWEVQPLYTQYGFVKHDLTNWHTLTVGLRVQLIWILGAN